MSKFSPLGSCQRQFLKKIDSSAPEVIPRGFLNQLRFAMWTPTTRQQHSRTVTRYQTDLTDAEWQVITPHLPKRDASPSAAIIDSQSVKTTEAGGPRGYDAGKKVNGRKRHALVDTDGRGLVIEPHPANVQDRDGGGPLLRASRRIFPLIQRVFADSGYAVEKVAKATLIAVEIVRKNPGQVGFAVNPRRWSSSGSSRGLGAIGGWQRTSKPPSTPHAPSSTPHPSCCSCVGSLVLHDFRNRLLDCRDIDRPFSLPGHRRLPARIAMRRDRDWIVQITSTGFAEPAPVV
jgi:transposase